MREPSPIKITIFATLAFLILMALLIFFANHWEEKELQSLDGMAYTFIVGKVEGNDDLLDGLLLEKAKGILKEGRHAFPGAAEEMGERYKIVRYDSEFQSGFVYYEIAFYRPSTNQTDYYNVVMMNTEKGWRIAENTSSNNYHFQLLKEKNSGTVVHKWGE